MRFLLAHGPNLDLLGSRSPEVYGTATLPDLEADAAEAASRLGAELTTFQTNHEGDLIERLHAARGEVDGIVLNAGAWTHTSYAIRDAIEAIEVPTVEVHLSNVLEREPFRRHSVLADVCIHTIYGRGGAGYANALGRLHAHLTHAPEVHRYGAHADQLLELRLPNGEGPHPAAVLLHGGFWRHHWLRDTLDPIALDLPQYGVASVNAEYRRVGAGGGGTATLEDVRTAIATTAELPGVDPDRLVVIGHSAGGQLALWAASRAGAATPIRLAASLAGVTDLDRGRLDRLGDGAVDAFLGGIDTSPFSPISLLPLGTPSLCVHGTEDEVVPVDYSERFVDAATVAGDTTELIVGDGDDHFAPIEPSHRLWHATRSRVVAALGRSTT